jgi:hypothetical protein
LTIKRHVDPLRLIAERLELSTLTAVARQPGAADCYRLTLQYHDGTHPDQVATLIFWQTGLIGCQVVYRTKTTKPLILTPTLPIPRLKAFATTLRGLKFDALEDMPNTPPLGVDLWLLERASGTFFHDVLLAPTLAASESVYAQIIRALESGWKESLRAI